MKPKLDKRNFVFCTIKKEKVRGLKIKPLLIFEEKEGTTLIITKKEAVNNKLSYENVWSLITLTVHSDLNAVGFLAAITAKLAEKEISVNAVSAYYHDHLFVRKEKAAETLKLIKKLSK